MEAKKKSGLELLREPFPAHQISKLPKPYKKDSPKGNCQECGGYHGLPAAHLDYVGHAALTDRLLDSDPNWTWEPLAVGEDGLPKFDGSGGLWIKLTVCGVTRLGYGNAEGKSYMDVGAREKEVIGDALRNAAMRFGAALDLWHKGDLHVVQNEPTEKQKPESAKSNTQVAWEGLDEGTRQGLMQMAVIVREYLQQHDDSGAFKFIENKSLLAEEKLGLWHLLDSKERSRIKKAGEQLKEAA